MGAVRVGIMSREFFDVDLGRMGGYGFAARQSALTLRDAGHEPILLAGSAHGPGGRTDVDSGGLRVVFSSGRRVADVFRWQALRLDALLTIDWHSSFLAVTRALPRTPVFVWSRDPRDRATWDRIATLRLPPEVVAPDLATSSGDPLEPLGASTDPGIGLLARRSARWGRSVTYVVTDEFLVPRFARRFGFEPSGWQVLGTPVDPRPSTLAPGSEASLSEVKRPGLPAVIRPGRPLVVFLGRLDPIKRPWVFAEVAAAVPEAEFAVLGQLHIDRGWHPTPAANLHWLGHVDGPDKQALLAAAVATVNTSIHETMALSLLESLHLATPLIACVDPGGIVHRFGIAVPEAPGDGLRAVPAMANAVRALVADADRGAALGAAGQQWVRGRHSRSAFLAGFEGLVGGAGR